MKSKRKASHLNKRHYSKRRTVVIPKENKSNSSICKRIFNKIKNLFSKLIHLIMKIIKGLFKFLIKNINTLLLIFVIVILIKFLYVLNDFQNSLHNNINEMNTNYETKLNEKVNELETKTQEEINNLENKISIHNKEKQEKEEQERQIQIAKAKQQERIQVTSRGGGYSRSTASISEYQAYARDLCLNTYGWSENDFQCLVKLWNRESGWNPNAHNKSSGAHGIPQSLPASKMASEGSDYYTNGKTQIRWGLKYIKNRYGSPSSAWSHSQSKGWY